jgi:glycosyltransferase involved in cell wall biosynthesis
LALTRPNGIFSEAGFPTKLGEYFACKKPVVITRVGDIPKYFKNEEHIILVEPGNIESIVNGFEVLINRPNLSDKISKESYVWMDQNLNYLNVSLTIDLFIDKLIQKRK